MSRQDLLSRGSLLSREGPFLLSKEPCWIFLVGKDLPSRGPYEQRPLLIQRGCLERNSCPKRALSPKDWWLPRPVLSRDGLLLGEGILSREGLMTVSCSERTSYPKGPPLKGILPKEGTPVSSARRGPSCWKFLRR